MSHLLIVILDDLKYLPKLLNAWRAAGVPGVTILQSAGAHRTRHWLSQVGLGALDRLFDTDDGPRRTLLAAIDDDDLLDRAVAEAEHVVGGFDRPHTGLLMVLPVAKIRGLHKIVPYELSSVPEPPAFYPECVIRRDTPVEEVAALLKLEPTIVQSDTPLHQVSRLMFEHPNAHVACVVAEDGRLIGVLDMQAVVDALFWYIMPEEFLADMRDLKDVFSFADRSRMRVAADVMQEPVFVKRGETVKDAFQRMHDHKLPGVPLVDERYRVAGYINLLELAVVCFQHLEQDSAEPDAGETR
jgi:CBS domain-containing protein